MTKEDIRAQIRLILSSLDENYSGINNFPYEQEDNIKQLPEDIGVQDKYLINWEETSANNDLYDFPIQEFQKGIQIEKAKKSLFNIMDIAKIVIDNLTQDVQFYSKMGV